MSPFCALQACGWCPLRPSCLRSALSFPQQAISTSAFLGLHGEVEVQCVRWSNSQFQHHDIRKCTKPWRCKTSTFTRSWTCQCFTTPRPQNEKLVSSLTGSRLHGSKFRDDTRGHSVPRIRFSGLRVFNGLSRPCKDGSKFQSLSTPSTIALCKVRCRTPDHSEDC